MLSTCRHERGGAEVPGQRDLAADLVEIARDVLVDLAPQKTERVRATRFVGDGARRKMICHVQRADFQLPDDDDAFAAARSSGLSPRGMRGTVQLSRRGTSCSEGGWRKPDAGSAFIAAKR